MLVRKLTILPLEAIVRGYISGSAYISYKSTKCINSVPVSSPLLESQRLPQVLFTPSTKPEVGHDENISMLQLEVLVGVQRAREVERVAIGLYVKARDYAMARGF